MHFGHNYIRYQYHIGEIPLGITAEEKDLGVLVTEDLKPTKQCVKAATKATNSLRLVKRAFTHIDAQSFGMLYKAYVRPQLEYCVQAWSPYYVKDIDCLEKVQRRATKMVPELKELSYEERLKQLNLYSLERRRLRGDLIETFKILKGLDKVNAEQFFSINATGRTRGHSMKLFKSGMKKGLLCRKHFFSQRVINEWNGLS
jgi:hypothetical protein